MEVLLEGALAAALLRKPHVLHYRGNTLDRPKLVFDALVAAWTRGADTVYCISGATAELFRRRGHRRQGRGPLQPGRPGGVRRRHAVRRDPRTPSARVPANRSSGRSDASIRERISRPSSAPPRIVAGARRPRLDSWWSAPPRPSVEKTYSGAARPPGARARAHGAPDLRGRAARHPCGDARARCLRAHLPARRFRAGRGRGDGGRSAGGRHRRGGAPGAGERRDVTGWCASPGDAGGFARQILELLADAGLAAALGARAATAARKFDAQTIADRVWTRYQALIGPALKRPATAESATQTNRCAQRSSAVSANSLRPTSSPPRCRAISALDGAGVEPELGDQRPAGELRAQRVGRGLAKPPVDRDFEPALWPVGEADPQARLKQLAHQTLVAQHADLARRRQPQAELDQGAASRRGPAPRGCGPSTACPPSGAGCRAASSGSRRTEAAAQDRGADPAPNRTATRTAPRPRPDRRRPAPDAPRR